MHLFTFLETKASRSEHEKLRLFSMTENIWRFLGVILATREFVILANILVDIGLVLRWRRSLGEILDEIPRETTLDSVLEITTQKHRLIDRLFQLRPRLDSFGWRDRFRGARHDTNHL